MLCNIYIKQFKIKKGKILNSYFYVSRPLYGFRHCVPGSAGLSGPGLQVNTTAHFTHSHLGVGVGEVRAAHNSRDHSNAVWSQVIKQL